ncbi:uncharacterized protein [Euphorbia lathyris]|uniref:uncharacterized protein n=1 Tax=Euphorbia lathyris TaxID=212925 RepID=UPI003313997C
MSTCVRPSPCRPALPARVSPQLRQQPHVPSVLPVGVSKILTRSLKLASHAPIAQYGPVLKQTQSRKYQKHAPVCLLGGKDKSEGGKEGFPWSLEKVMENFKGKSVEDMLRQQIEKEEFYDGGSGNNPPRGGGGGGRGDGFGEAEDEGIKGILDETLQVALATFGFIFLYVYIIYGEEMTLLAKDYLKFVLKGNKSVRLTKVMDQWTRFYRELTEPKEVDKFWLERAIINTSTAYDSPDKYRQVYKSMLAASKSDESSMS